MYNIVEKTMGWPGQYLAGSKGDYERQFRDHVVVFNANLVAVGDSADKIWYGDVDLYIDSDKLQTLANELKKDIYVLREMDGRFEKEEYPDLGKPVAIFHFEEKP